MYTGILHFHSGFRYIVLLLLVVAIVKSLIGYFGKKPYQPIDNKLALYAFIATHIQLTLGLLLYFISPIVKIALGDMGAAMKNSELRFWAVEHLTFMLLAVTFITIGRVVSKKASDDNLKFKRIAIYYSIGFAIMMVGIPWLSR